MLIFLTKVVTSILAGNTMILKSSEKAPLSSAFLPKLFEEAGVPAGVVNVLSGLGETGSLLASNMVVRKISFTGSTRTGRMVQQAATASNLKDVQLELGGKSAGIVWKDADLDSTVQSCLTSFTWNSGQLCSSTTRLYVHKDIVDEFTSKLKTAMLQYQHGDPTDKATTMGPQADSIQGEKVLEYLETGKQEGKVLIGGKRAGKRGWFVEVSCCVAWLLFS
jgi:aldehyde dehydrogenase (NAD+)